VKDSQINRGDHFLSIIYDLCIVTTSWSPSEIFPLLLLYEKNSFVRKQTTNELPLPHLQANLLSRIVK
jgi:hypothetical protein